MQHWYRELPIDTGGSFRERSPGSPKSISSESSSDNEEEPEQPDLKRDQDEENNTIRQVREITIRSENSGVKSEDQEGEFININQDSEHYLSNRGESMTSIMRETAITLKAVHSNSFNSELLKAKMFIIQVDNKITDAAEATDE